MLDSLEISKVKPQMYAEAGPTDPSAEMNAEAVFVGLTQDELDIIRWEGEGGQ